MSMEMNKHLYYRWSFISSFHSSFTTGFSAATTIIFLTLLFSLSSALTSTSDELQISRLSIGRSLLQALKECPIDVQNWNYTIVVSRCKGPRYLPEFCCGALRDLACPYSKEINDITNNCAYTMFSYINLYGHYPPGLFANVCRDSHRGLECTQAQKSSNVSRPTSSPSSSTAGTPTITAFFVFLTILYCLFLFL